MVPMNVMHIPLYLRQKIVRLTEECLNQPHNGYIYRPKVHLSENDQLKILINWF